MQPIISSKDVRIAVAFEKGYRTHEPLGKLGNLSFSACAGSRKARAPNFVQRVHIRWIVFTRRLTCRPAVLGAARGAVAECVVQKRLEDFLGKLQLDVVNTHSESGRKRALSNIEQAWRKLKPFLKNGGFGSVIKQTVLAVSQKQDDAQVVKAGLNYLCSKEKAWFDRQSGSCKIMLGHIAQTVGVEERMYKNPVSDPTHQLGGDVEGGRLTFVFFSILRNQNAVMVTKTFKGGLAWPLADCAWECSQ